MFSFIVSGSEDNLHGFAVGNLDIETLDRVLDFHAVDCEIFGRCVLGLDCLDSRRVTHGDDICSGGAGICTLLAAYGEDVPGELESVDARSRDLVVQLGLKRDILSVCATLLSLDYISQNNQSV